MSKALIAQIKKRRDIKTKLCSTDNALIIGHKMQFINSYLHIYLFIHILTCHQELNPPLCWHLLSGVVGDQVEHVGSAVGLSEVRHPQGAVLCAWFSQVLHPVLIGWIWEDASAVEHVPDRHRNLLLPYGLCFVWVHVCWEFYLCVMHRLSSRHHMLDRTLYSCPSLPPT